MKKNNCNKNAGFTIVEILVVLLIISVLAGLVGTNMVGHMKTAKVKAAETQISSLASALRQYQIDNDRLPTMEQGLQSLVERPVRPPVPRNYPSGGYLEKIEVPLDPWGNDYAYLVPGRGGKEFELISYGADGEKGGEDYDQDLSNLTSNN